MKHIPLESTIKNSIRKRLLEMGCWLRKTSPSPYGYQPGTLDFIGIYKGRGFCLEVKRPARRHVPVNIWFSTAAMCEHCLKECTPAQRAEIETVRKAGGIAYVVTSADEAQFTLEWYVDNARRSVPLTASDPSTADRCPDLQFLYRSASDT